MEPPAFAYDVFLSHNSQDKPQVARLAERLRAAGLKVWFDAWSIKPGDDIYLAIEHGLQASRVQLLCISPAALASDWVALERSTVLFRDPANAGRRFIPLLLQDCELPDALRRYRYVDYRGEGEAAWAELLEACRGPDSAGSAGSQAPLGNPAREAPASRSDGAPRVVDTHAGSREAGSNSHFGGKATGSKVCADLAMKKMPVFPAGNAGNHDQGWCGSAQPAPSLAMDPGQPSLHSPCRGDGLSGQNENCWEAGASPTAFPSRSLGTSAMSAANAEDEPAPLATLERKLEGHQDFAWDLAVSPDGTWAASAARDKTVKLWDLANGRCRAKLEGHTQNVKCVAITPDGQLVVSGSDDHSIRLWDAADGRPLAHWQASEHSVMSVVPLADNRLLLSCGAGNDPVVKLWDMHTQQCLATFEGHTSVVNFIALSRDQQRLVSASNDNTLRLWDMASGQCLTVLQGHTADVRCVQITPDGHYALSGSADKTIKLWDLHNHTCLGTLEGHQNTIHSVALSPDGGWLASTGFTDGTVRLWDWRAGTCVQVIVIKRGTFPISIAFSPDGARLLVGTTNGTIYVYRISRIHYAHCQMQPSTRFDAVPAARRYRNAKVVLLGEGTVGKTSLAHRLIDDEYVVKDRTHGMNVWRLELPEVAASPAPSPHGGRLGWGQDQTATALSDHPLPASPTGGGDHGAATEQEEEREALLWDLAGQEDYRLIHQLFLEETALALLLVNPQKDDPFAEAGDWLKTLQTAARNGQAREAARLLLFSQIDVGGMKVSDGKIQRFCEQYGFAGWLPTSAKSGENCSDAAAGGPSRLKQLIAQAIPWERLPWTSTPRLLAQLKNTVMDLRDAADIRLLRFAELAQRLEQALPEENFGEAEVRTAVTLLANHGLAQPLKFGDLVLLRPDLLNGYAGAVIRAARAHRDEIGSVAEAEVYGKDFDFTGVERLPRPDEELLLRALVQTLLDNALCIAEDTPQGRHLVFPSQYRRERDIPRHPAVFVSYTFCGEWQSVYSSLVVRLWYSNEFGHRELWHNAAEFQSSKGHCLGLKIDNRQGEGEATISVFFDAQVVDELKVVFIEYIHRHLARYATEVRRDRHYVCCNPSCGRPFKDMELIRELLAEGVATIVCQKCRTEVPLIDHIEQRLHSDPVAQQILRMEQTARRQLDAQALEQILIGHMMAITGEANQIFRPVTLFDHGIDGEVEFKNRDGQASGKKIYVQLKSGDSHLHTRQSDGREIFDVKNDRLLQYWQEQPVDVYLVIRHADERLNDASIRWMNLTRYLRERPDKASRQIVFQGEKLDAAALWRLWDGFFARAA